MLVKCLKAFAYTGCISMIISGLLEAVLGGIFHLPYVMLTPEYIQMFPSYGVAFTADIVLYGLIGMAFSAMMFIYEYDRLGFVLQNAIYYLGTAIVWLPIITIMWQLYRYPQALISTIIGFILTDVIMTIVAYHTTKKQIQALNLEFEKN